MDYIMVALLKFAELQFFRNPIGSLLISDPGI